MRIATALLVFCVYLVACTKTESESTARTQAPEAAAPATPVKKLLPFYELVAGCIAQCESVWWKPEASAGQRPKFQPALPLSFADLVSTPEDQASFVRLVEQFPQHLRAIGILQPGENEETVVDNGVFGSYKKQPPKLFGHLHNVILDGGRTIYVYSGIYYHRLTPDAPGSMHVAIEPTTKQYAGVIRAGRDLDEYYVGGADSLRSTLVAFVAAYDVEMFSMLAHYASGRKDAYENRAIMLPLHKDSDEALLRVALLNDKLGERGQATGVPAPEFLQRAKAAAAERAWYAVTRARDACVTSPMSPAQRIDLVKEAGLTPRVRDTNSDGKLAIVEVTADDGRYETTWRFFKKKEDCERTLASAPTPDRYR